MEYKTIAEESAASNVEFILSSVPSSLLHTKELQDTGATATSDSVDQYLADRKDRICLLDPAAKQELHPDDGSLFDVFLFGGILGTPSPIMVRIWLTCGLGDDPPRGEPRF